MMKKKKEFFVVEIPLLYELKLEKDYDYIILVKAKKKNAKKRFSRKDFEKRYKMFSKKEKKASFIIQNDESKAILEKKLKKIIKKIRRKNPHG